jgi:leucyl aminopeptidase
MIPTEFTDTFPEEEFIWARPMYEEKIEELSPFLQEAMRRKPCDAVVDVLIEEKNFITRQIVCKLGEKQSSTKQKREELGSLLLQKAHLGNESILLLDFRTLGNEALDLLTGIILSSWRFEQYRTIFKAEEKSHIKKIIVLSNISELLKRDFEPIHAMIQGVFYSKALTSEPPNILYPLAYAERLKELETIGIEVEILHEKDLHTIGMTALLGVGMGSNQPPCVAILKWNGRKDSSNPIVIVGKGVCFDSGGLCLKGPLPQREMKWDKAGAGVVAGLLKSLALNRSPISIIGIIGLVENMPDGKAIKPGDIIKTMSGQTIEIVDTDAEGRLVLADCLWFAQDKFQPKTIIDLGTLTMETFATLGSAYAGLYCNSAQLRSQLEAAGKISGDLVWPLPMGEYYAKQIQSPVADMKNLGVESWGENGAAAEFLRRFVKTIEWAHLDIAGVSWTRTDSKGVTGFGVRLLWDWIQSNLLEIKE